TKDTTNFSPVPLLAGKVTINGSNTNIIVPNAGVFTIGEIYGFIASSSLFFGCISGIDAGTNKIVLTNGDAYGINDNSSSSPLYISLGITASTSTIPASIIRLQMIHYFLNTDKMLIRRVIGVKGAGFTDSLVAEHVTNLQFRYLLNLSDPNGFVPQPK